MMRMELDKVYISRAPGESKENHYDCWRALRRKTKVYLPGMSQSAADREATELTNRKLGKKYKP